jgi:hypothetical protein
MPYSANVELLLLADRRASKDQTVRDVLTLAESLAIWSETRRFPEEADAPSHCRAVSSS